MRTWKWFFGVFLAGLAATALVIMGEIDSLLNTLQPESGVTTYGMSALNGFRFDGESEHAAFKLWTDATQAEQLPWSA